MRSQALAGLRLSTQRLAMMLYSQGQPLDVVRSNVIQAIEVLREGAATMVGIDRFDLRGAIDYTSALWLIAMAYCLGVDHALLESPTATLGNRGRDAVYERLLDVVGVRARPVARVLLPRPYKLLLRALEATEHARPGLIEAYLDHYYAQVTWNILVGTARD
jgi:hypothetical protein